MSLDTIEDIARHASSLMALRAPLPLVGQWVNFRIAEVAGQKRLAFYRRARELHTPATYTTGTATFTRNSRTVTGTGTTWAQSTHAGWHIRGRTVWYRVESVPSATEIRLESNFSEETQIGGSYVLARRFHPLPSDVQTINTRTFVHGRVTKTLESISQEELNLLYPSRHYGQGGLPDLVSETEPALDGSRQVEIFPYPATSELYYYVCYIKPLPLDLTALVPSFINPYTLVEGVKVDLLFYEATHMTEVNQKQVLFNEHRRQATYWAGKMQEALLQEKGLDDSQFLVEFLHERRGRRERAITTAYQDVWARP